MEFRGIATRAGLWVPEHDADLVPRLIHDDQDGSLATNDASQTTEPGANRFRLGHIRLVQFFHLVLGRGRGKRIESDTEDAVLILLPQLFDRLPLFLEVVLNRIELRVHQLLWLDPDSFAEPWIVG